MGKATSKRASGYNNDQQLRKTNTEYGVNIGTLSELNRLNNGSHAFLNGIRPKRSTAENLKPE